jgi:hypothetical protein
MVMAILNINAKEQLAQIEQDQAEWLNDVEGDLLPAQRDLYQAFKALQRQAAAARQAFEDRMNADGRANGTLAQGEAIVFNYRFGKLSISLGKERPRKAHAQSKPRQSLGAWLKARSDAGSAV